MVSTPIRAYITDDELLILNGYKAMLSGNGISVVGCAGNASTAIREIPILKPDIVIMDIKLPDSDGISAVIEIQKIYRVPCILITGYRDSALITRATQVGVYGYLHKPVDEIELVSMIEIALRCFREEQHIRIYADELERNLEERKIVERAKGVLMDDLGLKEAQAMKYIQKRSRDTNRRLVEVAQSILDHFLKL